VPESFFAALLWSYEVEGKFGIGDWGGIVGGFMNFHAQRYCKEERNR
jgi:hypothetical protein